MSKWVIGKYIRLSDADRDLMKKEGKTESESVSHQKALIQNFVNEKDELKDCEQYEFFDDGFSGTNFDRPSFEKLIEQIKKGKINCVIVKDFSRFGRDYIELGDYLERIFPFMGVRFISINDHYDSLDYKGTTGGLDVVFRREFYYLLQEAVEKELISVIISTHVTEDLDKVADYVAFIEGGKLKFYETKEELCERYRDYLQELHGEAAGQGTVKLEDVIYNYDNLKNGKEAAEA